MASGPDARPGAQSTPVPPPGRTAGRDSRRRRRPDQEPNTKEKPKQEPNTKEARLLNLAGVGVYLGLKLDSVKKLNAAGRLPRVKLPGIRRVLVDRVALDAALEAWRDG
jgi:hypothetical protein